MKEEKILLLSELQPCRFRGQCEVGGPGCQAESDDEMKRQCAAGFFQQLEEEEIKGGKSVS